MDMRQLIAQIDHIENKQILNEDAHYTTAQVDNRPRVSKSNNQTSIYEMLIKEFGYDLGEETLDEVAFSPEQQAKMGQANPQDPYIVARVLGKTAVPLSHFTDPADQAIAKQLGFKDGPAVAPAAPAGTAAQPAAPAVQKMDPNQADRDDAQMGADGRAMAAGGNSTSAATGVGNPGEQPAQDPAQDQYGNNIPISSTQTVTPDKAPAADPKKKQMAPVDPGTIELQKWIASKGYDIGKFGADGRWGKDTTKAIDAFWVDWKAGKISQPDQQQYQKLLGAAKDTEWTRYWYQKQQGGSAASPAAGGKGPTVAAAQGQAPGNPLNQTPGGQAVADQSGAETARLARQNATAAAAPNPKVAAIDAQLAGLKKYPQMNAQIIARLEKEKAALGSGGAAQPAPAAPAAPAAPSGLKPGLGSSPMRENPDTPAAESVRSQDDAILERIRTALFR